VLVVEVLVVEVLVVEVLVVVVVVVPPVPDVVVVVDEVVPDEVVPLDELLVDMVVVVCPPPPLEVPWVPLVPLLLLHATAYTPALQARQSQNALFMKAPSPIVQGSS
jgi:hypothetical protein